MARGDIDTYLQEGDVVTILGRINPELDNEFDMGWVDDDMDNCVGKTGTIRVRSTYADSNDITRNMYKISGCTDWWWIAEWLDVSPDIDPVPEEDFNSVLE